jgi:CSLREA domain-containing protein
LTVNTLADETTPDKFLSLREAIGVVDAGSTSGLSSAELAQISGTLGQNDTIQFAKKLSGGTITLTQGPLAITQNLAIQGLGAKHLAVSGNAASEVFDVSGGANVNLSGLGIADGRAASGGGILNEAGATLTCGSS